MDYVNHSALLNVVGIPLKLIWVLLFILIHFDPDSGINLIPGHPIYLWIKISEMTPWAWQEREGGDGPKSEA